MRRYVLAFCEAPAFTAMTAFGLIVTLAYTTAPSPPAGIWIACGVIAFLGGAVATVQFRERWQKLKAEEETEKYVRQLFGGLPEEEKAVLAELCVRKWMPGTPALSRLEQIGLVTHDWTTGLFRVLPDYAQTLPRVVKEWRAGKARNFVDAPPPAGDNGAGPDPGREVEAP